MGCNTCDGGYVFLYPSSFLTRSVSFVLQMYYTTTGENASVNYFFTNTSDTTSYLSLEESEAIFPVAVTYNSASKGLYWLNMNPIDSGGTAEASLWNCTLAECTSTMMRLMSMEYGNGLQAKQGNAFVVVDDSTDQDAAVYFAFTGDNTIYKVDMTDRVIISSMRL